MRLGLRRPAWRWAQLTKATPPPPAISDFSDKRLKKLDTASNRA